MNTQFDCQETFLFHAIRLSQTVLIQTIQFSISIVFVHSVKCQNSSILSYSVEVQSVYSIAPGDWAT